MYAAIVTYEPNIGKRADEIVGSFESAVPMFSDMPGLVQKYFCFDDDTLQGTSIYIWESREAAETCFGSQLFRERFKQTFGCEPSIAYTEVKLVLNNAEKTANQPDLP